MTGRDNTGTSSTANNKNSSSNSLTVNTTKNITTKLDFTEDPFRDYRYEDPFNIGDPFADTTDSNDNYNKQIVNKKDNNNTLTNKNINEDPFGMKISNGKMTPSPSLPSEDQQLAWASAESLRLEKQRKKEAMQEIADLELALALSKKDKSRNRVANSLKKILP